jgi:transposase
MLNMAKTFRDWNPEQSEMFPPTALDLVEADDLVHFIRHLVVEQLDLSEILSVYQEERGYPPMHPQMMTALLLYSYCQGIYASRRIARGCRQRVDYMALTGMQKPDFRTVSLFRKRHLKALQNLFKQVLRLCEKAGLVKLGHVAIDGTRIQANASKHKSMSYGGMKKKEAELEDEIRGWFEEAERVDQQEDELYGAARRGDELPDWVADKQKRLEKIRQAKKELEEEARAQTQAPPDPHKTGHKKKPTGQPADKTQRNFTDPESRIMKSPGGFIQGYNGQAAVDAGSQVIVAQGLTNNGVDTHEMEGLLEKIRENLNRQAKEVSADSAYCCTWNLTRLRQRHIRGYVAVSRQQEKAASKWIRQMKQRLKKARYRSRYRLRKQTVEPVFGQIKFARGFRQFLLRGIEKVSAEWSLLCTAHNLLKLSAAQA